MSHVSPTWSCLAATLASAALVGCGGGSPSGEPGAAGTTNDGGASAGGGASGSGASVGGPVDTGPNPLAGSRGVSESAGAGGTGTAGGGSTSAGGTAANGADGGRTGTGEIKFSFFVTSLRALLAKAGPSKPEGFGADLSYGETGPGAGLRGADKLCAAIAEDALPGAGSKPWRAFLSAVKDENGEQVDAIDRIGSGPWYDRTGRLVAASKADLLADRPQGADAAIINDLPNEDGVPNHRPDPSQDAADNHHMLTGSNREGRLHSATATCLDWTHNQGDASEGRPRAGLAWPRAMTSGSATNWMSAVDAPGCAPGVRIMEGGGPQPNDNSVGNGGGYGGFYCFSQVP